MCNVDPSIDHPSSAGRRGSVSPRATAPLGLNRPAATIQIPQSAIKNLKSKIQNSKSPAFTLIEMLVVISIIGVIAALVVGLAPAAGRAMRQSRVKGELQQLMTAIDEYKAKYGHYPPDNVDVLTGVVNPGTNQLYYELSGTLFNTNPPNFNYVSPDGATKLSPIQLNGIFGRKGFVNVSLANNNIPSKNPEDPKGKNFLPNLKPSQIGQIPVNGTVVQVLVVAVEGRNALGQPVRTNMWRYVSSPDPLKLSPTAPYLKHNPNSYDLWAEVLIGNEVKVIGNW
jgi:prepilin-type N-terminal cleavage/methylation domain-containing protein